MSCFAKDATPVRAKSADPTRHVNYVRGMVLGVDEFTQEFAYLSGRDQWLARDLIGYGTVRGLEVLVEDTGEPVDHLRKWKVTVSAGAALDPCGRLVCVPRAQCGYLNEWLKGHADDLKDVVAGPLTLDLTLAYRDCETDATPIPGEPCRSEDELMAPSRIADDFLVELSLKPTHHQKEEDTVIEFSAWLAAIPLVGTGGASREGFALAVAAWQPGSVVPAALQIPQAEAADFLRDALRIWVTQLRPVAYGRTCGCAAPEASADHDERVLLARLVIDVEQPSGQPWRVKSRARADESTRPILAHLRLLADTLLRTMPSALPAALAASPSNSSGPSYETIAAGVLRGDGQAQGPLFGGLAVKDVSDGQVVLTFDGYELPAGQHQYIVNVLGISTAKIPSPVLRLDGFLPEGIALRVNPSLKKPPTAELLKEHLMMMVEINAIRAAN